ncbi:CDP-alcohol phosphatidyltransferase family protein [Actinoplanes missouriensis]|uniref:CDP-alcohol phosphatidyltransferase family protein n=1 Tax=Actinoplanes missouriensis TaxID=1866 RepID=UPI0033C6A714
MTWEEYATAWSRLHGGFDPRQASPVVRGWVRGAYRIGSFLGRRGVSPFAVTLAGVVLCLAVPVVALAGPAGVAVAALLVLLAAMADGLDGAVAVVTGRVSRAGFVYDSVADRVGEAGWLAAFWVAGAPGWLVVAAGAASWLHEYVRARAVAAGMAEIGAVTVGERPTRVSIALCAFLFGAVAAPAVLVGAAAWLLMQIIGFAQLIFAVRRALR